MRVPKLRFSNSSIKTVLRCEQKYVYKYVQGLQPKRKALPLKLGSWLHELLDARYQSGTWIDKQRELSHEFSLLFEEERNHYGDLPGKTSLIMEGYDWAWRGEEEEWEFLDSELKIETDIGSRWTYVGVLDRVATNQEGLWIWDTKTFRGKAPTRDFRTTDPQSALYIWAYRLVYGVNPVGFLFDYVRTKAPSVPRFNKDGKVSRAKIDTNWYTYRRFLKDNNLDPKEFRQELATARARDRDFYDRVMVPKPTTVIKSLLDDIKELLPRIRRLHEGGRPIRTLTYECERGCEYHLICLTELTGGDSKYLRKQGFIEKGWEEYGDDEEEVIGEPEATGAESA